MTQPASPNIYGYDLVCRSDMTSSAAECGGVEILANALYRRAISPRGCLIDDRNYGYDLNQFVNLDLSSARDLATIGANLDAEFRKDPRVYQSSTLVSYDSVTKALKAATTVTPNGGPTFNLVLGTTAVLAQGIQILSVSPP
jgi:hypothetical protein